ncbi:MAG: hypothetical protein MIO90_00025 [Methanomassiliicoccales archaeon]|nr:hypothetical protein [Methanomassiliicoccales archaeon]
MNVGEFAWKNVDRRKGSISAVWHGLKFLVLPMVLVLFGLFAVAQADSAEKFEGLLQEMQMLVLIFGIALIVLGFFKGGYPKGSYSRLTLGMTVAVLAIVYVFSLLLDGRLQTVISDELFELDLALLFVLYFVVAIFNIFMQLGELVDYRRAWSNGNAQITDQEKEDPEQHRWFHDFRLRYGSLFNGIKLSKTILIGFVIIPLALVIVIKAAFSSLSSDEVDVLLEILDRIITFVLMLGLPMTFLAFFKGFYPRGSFSRFLPAIIMVLISLYWIWELGLEGRLVIDSIEDINIDLDFSALLLLLVIGISLWIVYYVLELWLYRPEWKEGGFQKDLGGKQRKIKGGKAKEQEPEAKEEDVVPQEN